MHPEDLNMSDMIAVYNGPFDVSPPELMAFGTYTYIDGGWAIKRFFRTEGLARVSLPPTARRQTFPRGEDI